MCWKGMRSRPSVAFIQRHESSDRRPRRSWRRGLISAGGTRDKRGGGRKEDATGGKEQVDKQGTDDAIASVARLGFKVTFCPSTLLRDSNDGKRSKVWLHSCKCLPGQSCNPKILVGIFYWRQAERFLVLLSCPPLMAFTSSLEPSAGSGSGIGTGSG